MENKFYPKLNEQGHREAQKALDKFTEHLKGELIKVAKECSLDFYANALPHLESDAWINMRSSIIEGLCDYRNSQKYPCDYKKIRKAIYKEHKEMINKDLNQDLLNEIEELKETINNFYRTYT